MRRVRPRIDRAEAEARGKTTLHATLRSERGPMEWKRAVSIALDVAEDLAEAEATQRAVAALAPDVILVDRDRALVLFDEQRPDGTLSPMWCPPAQADGARFDHAANRYVLGLLLYKMLTGSHPFGGGGLRKALESAANAEAPPFKPEVAEPLPPGLQSVTLRLLHPDTTKRPISAEAVADALSRFYGAAAGAGNLALPQAQPARRVSHPATEPAAPIPQPIAVARGGARSRQAVVDELPTMPSAGVLSRKAPVSRDRTPPPPRVPPPPRAARGGIPASTWIKMFFPIVLGVSVAAAAMTTLEPPKKAAKSATVKVGSDDPLTAADLEASDCASCHARQTSEWRRSVMGHAVKSPLFNALESLVEEQVGRDFDCPNGAGILRKTTNDVACRDPKTGLVVSGSGGEHWCVNCHAPTESQQALIPVWQGRAGGDPRSLFPVRDLLDDRAMEGISCGFCHQVHGPVNNRFGGYQGNPTWTSFATGAVFESRPEDRLGIFGIANSGYDMQPASFVIGRSEKLPRGPGGSALVHKREDEAMGRYLRSSEFCGSCHDVRLFGSDVIGATKGEHFKRLRNAYTEWKDWAAIERRQGREPATCQGCHMSTFPGVCSPDPDGDGDDLCPKGSKWSSRAPGRYPDGRVATNSDAATKMTTHYLSGVDLPLSREYPEDLLDEDTLDISGIPISAKKRRDALLKATFEFGLGQPRASGSRLTIPVDVQNIGAGHRVPAGFSQEREFWVHLVVKDRTGRVVYEVGRVDRNDEDLHDKEFVRVNTDPSILDGIGRPLGLFGADVRDGRDKPLWNPNPSLGGTRFVGRGLINFQNGFLRCVTCIGTVDGAGDCQPLPGQELNRADRFADGQYDQDTGECRSNLFGDKALFETYFPVGALDSTRGIAKAPDAIIDTRSVPPGVPISYTYDLDVSSGLAPFTVTARLLFRAFPPFLVKAFADYERQMDRLGRRPSGPLVDDKMLERLEVVEIEKVVKTTGVQ